MYDQKLYNYRKLQKHMNNWIFMWHSETSQTIRDNQSYDK